MKRLLIMAIGNRLMKDDGIALLVAEHLKHRRLNDKNVEFVIGETDFSFCIDCIKEDDFLIVIDAINSNNIPGNIVLLSLSDIRETTADYNSQHDIGIPGLMRFYPKIDGYLIGIEAAEIGYGLELSNHLKQKFDDICLKVEKQILKILEERTYA